MGFFSLNKGFLNTSSKQTATILPVRIVFVLILALTSAGCSGTGSTLGFLSGSSSKKVADAPESKPAELYKKADDLLTKQSYESAAKEFENVDRIHPYSPYARRAIAMAAFSYYKGGKYSQAISAAKRYNKLHPGTKETAMTYNIIAMANYDQIRDPKRDQSRSRLALGTLKEYVRRFPNSKYTPKARNRIRIVSDLIAASEMNVGRYYLKRKNYAAAINRFKGVVKDFQTTQQVEEALMRLTEGYLSLGVASEAQTAAAVLGHNFPRSRWYKDAYALLQKSGLTPKVDSGSWLIKQWSTTVKSTSS